MNYKNLFIFNAIAALVYGVLFVIVPEQVAYLHGMESPSPELIMTNRFFGGALVTIGLLCWLVKDLTNEAWLRAVSTAFIVGYLIGFAVALTGTLNGTMNAMGWIPVAIYLILTLGFTYLAFGGKSEASA